MTERSYAWPQSLNRLDPIQEEGKDDDAVEPPRHGEIANSERFAVPGNPVFSMPEQSI
jgi:hypothetical protein